MMNIKLHKRLFFKICFIYVHLIGSILLKARSIRNTTIHGLNTDQKFLHKVLGLLDL